MYSLVPVYQEGHMDKTDHKSTLDESISEWTGALCFPNTYPLDNDLSGG